VKLRTVYSYHKHKIQVNLFKNFGKLCPAWANKSVTCENFQYRLRQTD